MESFDENMLIGRKRVPVLYAVGWLLGILAHSDEQRAAAEGDVHRQDAVPLRGVVYPQPEVIHLINLHSSCSVTLSCCHVSFWC